MASKEVRAAVKPRTDTGSQRSTTPAPLVVSSDLLRRTKQFCDSIERVLAVEDSPLSAVIEETLGPVEAVIKGRPTVLFGTNSYLGLNFHPECIRAATEALTQYGTGSTASRVASGNHRLHLALEKDIAALYGRSHAIVFSTGFMANLGVIAALAHEGDAIFIDAHCHASIFDASRLSGAQIRTFAHNDSHNLDRLLSASDIPGTRSIVVLEGVYSVWGDVGDLKSIIAVARRHGAIVIVDEAHAMGIYGKHGRGVVEHLGLEDEVDVIVGTFSKSIGAIGGYCVTNRPELRSLRFMARAYLYTASLPLSIVASARAALRLISSDPGLRKTLWRNIETFHGGLTALGLTLCAPPGPVGGIKMPGVRVCYDFWKGLLDGGVYVNMLMPPATPGGEVVLRFSVSAAHTPAQIEKAIGVFREVSKALKVI